MRNIGDLVRVKDDDTDWYITSVEGHDEYNIEQGDVHYRRIKESLLQDKYIMFFKGYKWEGYSKDILYLYSLLCPLSEMPILIKNLRTGGKAIIEDCLLKDLP